MHGTLPFFRFLQAAGHTREWQRQQPLVVSCSRAAIISKSIILYVDSCACYSSAAVTHDKKHLSVEATYFYIIVINNSLKIWCAQLMRLWLSILGEWAAKNIIDMRQKAEGRWYWCRRWVSALISTILS